MDVRGYVYSLVDDLPSILKPGARFIADRVFAIWDDISAVLRISVPWWKYIRDSVSNFTTMAMQAAEQGAFAIRWLATIYLPRIVSSTAQAVIDWTSRLIDAVRQTINDVRDWLLDQARRMFNTVTQYATDIYHWAIDRLREIWEPLSIVVDRVGALLFDPRKLAEWVIGAIWSAFWRYADDHIDAIVEFVWQRRSIVVGRILARAESILERLL